MYGVVANLDVMSSVFEVVERKQTVLTIPKRRQHFAETALTLTHPLFFHHTFGGGFHRVALGASNPTCRLLA